MASYNLSRRAFARGLAFGAAALYTPGAFAEALTLTPRQTEGPFYPDHLPLDTDNDLLLINDSITPAIGEITHLSGRILDADGQPLRNAVVEIWQVDGNGVYLHSRSARREARRQLPGLRPLHHRLDRRLLLPHGEAGDLPRPHAAHSLRGQPKRQASSSRRSCT